MHEAMKAAVGIACANCNSCVHLESEGDYEAGIARYYICTHKPGRDRLKSFPFNKEQKCWEPEFWHTKFADLIDGTDASCDAAAEAFRHAINGVTASEGGDS